MKKRIRKIKLGEGKEADLDYWQSQSTEERLSTVQELREQYIRLFNKREEYNEARKGLRRFYKLTKQA